MLLCSLPTVAQLLGRLSVVHLMHVPLDRIRCSTVLSDTLQYRLYSLKRSCGSRYARVAHDEGDLTKTQTQRSSEMLKIGNAKHRDLNKATGMLIIRPCVGAALDEMFNGRVKLASCQQL